MARFPYYQKNIVALGKLLANARIDERCRTRLKHDPASELRKIGLPENVLKLMAFEIVDAESRKVTVLPYKLNQSRLDGKDPAYLGSLARQFC
ncbi:hypothetical protein [Labrenzia sp. PHM005]|uniref:hypothetical protein n=1 Tax=Labrenzia sp. PHM005 TaxID=2590016 RepID=UPI0011402C8F|nr:hypothetical protein [Labrenzia sp. PHM005]QDG77491.1 hypothetical protein FJ695_17350 [Labrenzia sp. PHM005]